MSSATDAGAAELLDRLGRAAVLLGTLVQPGVPLAPLTTYRVGGPAALFAAPRSFEELTRIAEVVAAVRIPVLVVGRGSNLLVSDEGFAGLAISLGAFGDDIAVEGTDVTAGGAVLLPVLARRTAAASLTGLEWMVGVPGSVGGAVRMNAGGHGSDVAANLVHVELFDLHHGIRDVVPTERLGLRFRGSRLGAHQVVLRARFALGSGDRESSEREITEIVRWRREHQPGGQNAGSVFVNPIPGELAAGRLIDEVGLRGFRIGTAHVSEKHANFVQADEGARAADVRAVMDEVRRRVFDATGHLLRSEVRLVGFPDVEPDDDEVDL